MGRQPDIEPNTNHTRDVTKQGEGKNVTAKKPTTSEKGKYVGQVKGTHVHIVGRKTHLQIGTDRKDFDPQKQSEVNQMIAFLKSKDPTNAKPGSADVARWLAQPAGKRN